MRNISSSNMKINIKMSKNIKFFLEQIQHLQKDAPSELISTYLEKVKEATLNPQKNTTHTFASFVNAITTENKRYNSYCEKLKANGSKGGRPPKNQMVSTQKPNGFSQPQSFAPVRETAFSNILLYKYNNKST